MRILVLGGSVFLSREVAAEAARRGHDVVAACRGTHPLPGGVTHVPLDRTEPDWSRVEGTWDAVVETQESPAWIAAALDRLADRAGHWTYVSSVSAYADESTPGGTPDTLPLRAPVTTESDAMDPETYGGHKVACERLVADATDRHLLVRPGLIVGPGDPSGRFTYWPVRLGSVAPGSEVLAPGDPDDPMQVLDVRDQANWHVDAIEAGLTGTVDVAGPRSTIEDVLAGVAAGVGAEVVFRWVPGEVLVRHDVEPWSGERAVPLWLPQPDYAGMVDHDVSAAHAMGLRSRPIQATARDTLDWALAADGRVRPDVAITGIARKVEQELLAAFLDA